ncbi:MAG: ABC transporter ATP-binding protein [Veillonella caviae]|nr:ABC transporter ATP-binding protein [Veillonella caviae]MDY5482277.1 ABC transporter ATP-binding protein [Veillonella caviae]
MRGDLDFITHSSVTMLIAALITVSAAVLGVALSAHISARIGETMRNDLVHAIQNFSLRDFAYFGTGTILMRTSRDIEKIQSVIDESLNMIFPTPLMILLGLGLTFFKSWQLGFIILTVMVLMVICMMLLQRKALPLVKKMQLKLDDITDMVRDHIVGMSVIRAFNRSHDENRKEQELFCETAVLSKSVRQTYAIGLPTILIMFNMSSVCILWVGGYNVSIGTFQIGDIMAVIEYANLILLNLLMSVFVIIDVPEAMICYQRIRKLLEHKNTDVYSIGAAANNATTTTTSNTTSASTLATAKMTLANTTNDIPLLEFRNVTFCYDNAEAPALENISFTVRHSKTLAIMGDIGSSKSTLVNLIMRFYEVLGGRITIDGIDIRNMSRESLHKEIGMVLQDAWIFTGTIAENIGYGKANATREEIEYVAKLAMADHFIRTLPQGYDTVLKQSGDALSQGQRQLITIAHAFLADPKILILDEATANVDTRTEVEVQKAMNTLLQGRTSIVIAHRLATIKNADFLLVVENGTIIEKGPTKNSLSLTGNIKNCTRIMQLVCRFNSHSI